MANSKKRCKYCKEYVPVESGIQVPGGFFCSFEHAAKFGNEKQANNKAKAQRVQHKKDKLSIKPKAKWLAEAQALVNKYIRVRDYWEPCISCGKSKQEIEAEQGWKTGGAWDAGHFMTRGAKPQLRFILFNIHKQCKSCNAGGGKFSAKAATVDANYRINLIKKIGIKKVEWLENHNGPDARKGDTEYLKRIKKIFSKRFRLHKKLKGLN